MQQLLLLTFVVIFVASFATTFGLPQVFKFLPEVMSAIMMLYVVVAGTRQRFKLVAPKYWLAFGALVLLILGGFAANGVSSGAVLAELRFYLRAMPLFFLPAVCEFSDDQLRQQIRVLLGLDLLQLPIAVLQRWVVWSEGRFTGDPVQGTLGDSGVLSIILICSWLVLTGLFLRGRVSKRRYVILLTLLLVPTTIDETKATVLFVPIGLFVVMFVGAAAGRKLRMVLLSAGILVVFGAAYIQIYDLMEIYNPQPKTAGIVQFFSDEKGVKKYMSSDISGLGTAKDVRRGDALSVPLGYLAKDPIRLSLGLGLGGVAPSKLGPNFEGPYRPLFAPFMLMSVTYFLLELGVLGTGVILLLFWLVFRDALAVAANDSRSLIGGIAVGWSGVVILMCISIFYEPIHLFESASYLYWYFSGLIVARRMQLSLQREGPQLQQVNALPPLSKGLGLKSVR